jgi:hypothetical protein
MIKQKTLGKLNAINHPQLGFVKAANYTPTCDSAKSYHNGWLLGLFITAFTS